MKGLAMGGGCSTVSMVSILAGVFAYILRQRRIYTRIRICMPRLSHALMLVTLPVIILLAYFR